MPKPIFAGQNEQTADLTINDPEVADPVRVTFGPAAVTVAIPVEPRVEAAVARRQAQTSVRLRPAAGVGDLTEELLAADWWNDAMVRAAGIPIVDVPFVTVGGGIGSFVTVDYLRIAGVAPDRIRVLSNIDFPWQTYEYLTRVSQIPGPERIRSDSASRPDNIWGFPSYALGEAIREKTLRPVWQVLVEPVFADYYTPRVGHVFTSLQREAKRIGYHQMLVKGQARLLRRRHGGGYFTMLTPPPGTAPWLSTEIVHLFRTYVSGAHGPNAWNRRKGGDGFAYQGFNYPKSVWGGQLKARMRRLEGDELARAYKAMGGTSTPRRRSWQAQLREGRAGGWYRTLAGTVEEMRLEDGMVVSRVKTAEGPVDIAADFLIDCTGLEADITEHRLLNDLLAHSGAGRNPLGRLDVERNFEVRGTGNSAGAVYASGAATLGGYFPGVDTFLGLQIAAQEITDDLARRGFCRRIGPMRSTAQWLRWAANQRP